jgi:hypothetical protein
LEEKVEGLLQKINNKTEGALTDFLLKCGLCPNCGDGPLQRKDQEFCCTICGAVVESERFSLAIPFGFENTPGSKLATGKGYGDTLGEKGLWALLSKVGNEIFKCPECGAEFNDLPIRARQLMTQIKKIEHPTMLRLILLGQKRCDEWGYDDHKEGKSAVFRNYYGDVLRSVGAVIIVKNQRERLERVADACLALAFRKQFGEDKFNKAVEKYSLDEAFLSRVVTLAGGSL